LSILLDEQSASKAKKILEKSELRLGSFLLKVEITQSINRYYHNHSIRRKSTLNYAFEILKNFELLSWNEKCESELQTNKLLYPLKSLDAMHVATYLVIKKMKGIENLKLVTFDDKMLQVAKSMDVNNIITISKK
jgi:predicted nucleic acid-binding protein